MGAKAEFEGVGKRFGEIAALCDFTLGVREGELLAVLGPSGCGKSTLLRVTAGLESLSAGSIHLNGRRIDSLPPPERDVAMVFQSYALYPHMTVRGNIEFPLRMRKTPQEERLRRVEEVAEFLEITQLLDRRPGKLSGGQRQRVALARALVRHPALFLLDEPLSNLDARLRISVRQHIRDVQRRLGVTTLYVTHDQTEAMTLGDRIVVLNDGRIQQVDTPVGLYERPANLFVAGFIGTPPMNLLSARHENGELVVGEQRLRLTRVRIGARTRLIVGIRPEAFRAAGGAEHGVLVARPNPASREVLGSETLVRASVDDQQIIARLFGIAAVPDRLVAPLHSLHLFDSETGERIG